MESTIERLEHLLEQGRQYLAKADPNALMIRPDSEKWSKKEILGHLLDSAVNNLKRFTEIQFSEGPYLIVPYNQKGLVTANNYQAAELGELSNFWLAINQRIIQLMKHQTDTTLAYPILQPDGSPADLRFLMVDYVDHLAYHVRQIVA
ncbi:MAG: DinB family protein [Bacteroidota bacterium]